jgi:hypothetical protein
MSSALLPLLDDDDDALFGDGWDDGSLLLPSDDALLRCDAGGEASSVAPWRCLDGEHAAPCARCAAPPAAGADRSVELRGSAPGKKDGEKRLRALLARTPEWLSGAARDAAADAHALQPGAARLVAALRARHSAELRKADLLALCRHWRYASDVWGRKSDGRVPPPRRRPAETALAPALAAAPLQLAAKMGSEAQAVAAAQALVKSRLQALVADSVRGFSNTEHSAALAAQLHRASPEVMPAVAAALRKKKTLGTLARDTMERLTQLATQRHAVESILSQFKAGASYKAYLQVCGILLSQLVGQTVANKTCLAAHVELLAEAEQQLVRACGWRSCPRR